VDIGRSGLAHIHRNETPRLKGGGPLRGIVGTWSDPLHEAAPVHSPKAREIIYETGLLLCPANFYTTLSDQQGRVLLQKLLPSTPPTTKAVPETETEVPTLLKGGSVSGLKVQNAQVGIDHPTL
jgi:hypothetical protein